MKDIRIGGKSINAKEEAYTRGHYIVDSGTTDSYLPRAMKNEFLQVFKEVAGRDYQVGTSCHGYTNEDLASLPKIQLVMEAYGDENGEVIIDIPPEQYLLHNDNSYCGSIYLSENAGGVIGANLMMNRDVIFDNGNQRVGFVDADCAYQGGNSTKTTPPSIGDHITSSSNSSETTAVPAATAASNASVPASTSAVAGTTLPVVRQLRHPPLPRLLRPLLQRLPHQSLLQRRRLQLRRRPNRPLQRLRPRQQLLPPRHLR